VRAARSRGEGTAPDISEATTVNGTRSGYRFLSIAGAGAADLAGAFVRHEVVMRIHALVVLSEMVACPKSPESAVHQETAVTAGVTSFAGGQGD